MSSPAPASAPSPLPLSSVPDLDALIARYGAAAVRARDLPALLRWLGSLTLGAPFADCAAALDAGARWLRSGPDGADEPGATARLRILLDTLESAPAWRRTFVHAVGTVLAETTALHFYETGLPNDRGLGRETADRMARRFLPTPRDERDLGEHLARWFPKTRHAEWVAALPSELIVRLCGILDGADAGGSDAPYVAAAGGGDVWGGTRRALLDAVALVATRTSALGLSREIRARSHERPDEPDAPLAGSPFFQLPRACDALLDGTGTTAACREQIAACRAALEAVHAHLEQFGVSVDVVYRIDVIGLNLDRLSDLIATADATDAAERAHAAAGLVARLAAARVRDRSVRDLIRTNVRLMARKIIERAGETGEHYITATRREYWKMLASAGGGGVLTAGTAALKYIIVGGGFPLFIEGFFSSCNYAASFLLMQLCGFTLASKQPSMTGAALAGALHASKDPKLDDLVTLIARICRSQLAAAIGNVGFVIPAVIAFNFFYARSTGHAFMNEHGAEHALESLHPWHSGTIYFAALTGVWLWLSSLAAGWLENWFTYRRLGDGIAQHRLGRIFGRGTMRFIARKLAHNIAGIGGNIAIGVLLGMIPVFGKFLGLPLEVRHVTLSTGSLAFAACTLGSDVFRHGAFWAAAGGIAIIGSLNFGVSFVLALGVAMRARGVEHAGLRILRGVLARVVRSPREFFLPPRTS